MPEAFQVTHSVYTLFHGPKFMQDDAFCSPGVVPYALPEGCDSFFLLLLWISRISHSGQILDTQPKVFRFLLGPPLDNAQLLFGVLLGT